MQYVFNSLAAALGQFHTCSKCSILWARRPGVISYIRYVFITLGRRLDAVSYFPYGFHTLARRLGIVSYVFSMCPYIGPVPWRSFIFVRYICHILGRRRGAVSYFYGTLFILWAGALAQFHLFRYVFILWAGARAQFHICSIHVHTLGRRPGPASYVSILCSYCWPAAWRRFVLVPFGFDTLGRRIGAVLYMSDIRVHTLGQRLGAVSYLIDTVSLLWVGSLAPFHICTMHVPYLGPAPWCSFIVVRYMLHHLGRRRGAVSFFVDTCSILWAGALAQFHRF